MLSYIYHKNLMNHYIRFLILFMFVLTGPALLEFMMGMQCYMLIFTTMEIVVFCDLF